VQVADDGEEKEHAAEHVAPLGDPRHRLDAQRVDGEEQRGHRGREAAGRARLRRDGGGQHAQRDEIRGGGGEGVQQEVDGVIAGRPHAPEHVVEPGVSHVSGM